MSKHTLAPWHKSRLSHSYGIYDANGTPIAKVVSSHSSFNERCSADAKLIAASPELLEALKGAVHVMEPLMQNDGYIAVRVGIARAAINKAEGKA